MGVVKSYNLKPGGDKISVTKQNRKGESTNSSPCRLYRHYRCYRCYSSLLLQEGQGIHFGATCTVCI